MESSKKRLETIQINIITKTTLIIRDEAVRTRRLFYPMIDLGIVRRIF